MSTKMTLDTSMPVSINQITNFISVETTDTLGSHLNNLLHEAENRIHELSGLEDIPQAPFSTRASFSSIIGEFRFCQG